MYFDNQLNGFEPPLHHDSNFLMKGHRKHFLELHIEEMGILPDPACSSATHAWPCFVGVIFLMFVAMVATSLVSLATILDFHLDHLADAIGEIDGELLEQCAFSECFLAFRGADSSLL